VWARKASAGGMNPTLRALLRIFDPGTSTYTELGAADLSITTDASAAWASYTLAWSLTSVTARARASEQQPARRGQRNQAAERRRVRPGSATGVDARIV